MSDLSFPGVTICNSIAIKKSMLLTIANDDQLLNVNSSKKLQVTLDNYYRKYLLKYPMEDLINDTLHLNDVVNRHRIICLVDQINKSKYCNNLQSNSIASSEKLQSCWTLFHFSHPSDLISNKFLIPSNDFAKFKVVINNLTIISAEETAPLAKNEIMRLVYRFNRNESTSLHLPVTGSIRFHDNSRIPAYFDNTIELNIGQYLQIGITKLKYKMLRAPFDLSCRNYHSSESASRTNPLFGPIFSNFDCTYACVVKRTIQKCRCWPPEIPFIIDYQGNGTKNIYLCDWMSMAEGQLNQSIINDSISENFIHQQRQLQKLALKNYISCSSVHFEKCNQKCPYSCEFSFIESNAELSTFEKIQKVNGEVKVLNRRNTGLISVKYETENEIVYNYKPKYEFLSTMSNVLGIISLWTAFKMVAFPSFCRSVIKLITRRVKKV